MFRRWLTGLTIAVVAGGVAWAGSVWWFGFVMLGLGLASLEWARLADASTFAVLFVLLGGAMIYQTPHLPVRALLPLLLVVPAAGMLWSQSPERGRDIVWSGAGLIWLSLPAALLVLLRQETGFVVLLVLLLGTAAQDTCAFYAGRWFGGTRPFTPVISPHKTWAGLGGSVLGMGAVVLAGGWYRAWPVGGALALGLLLGVLGQVGDLCMSSLKRRAHVEDSGVVFPGHGGILDRADGLVFNVAAFYPLALWMEGWS